MIAHGAQKMFGWFGGKGLEGTANVFYEKLGIPEFLAYIASFTEFFGGIFLITGFLTRLSSIGIAITMAVAAFYVHGSNGFFMPNGYEFALSLLIIAIVIIFEGPGKISLDDKIFNKK